MDGLMVDVAPLHQLNAYPTRPVDSLVIQQSSPAHPERMDTSREATSSTSSPELADDQDRLYQQRQDPVTFAEHAALRAEGSQLFKCFP